MRYLIDSEGYFKKETSGQVSPHGELIYPDNSVAKKPPPSSGDKRTRWDGSKWVLEINPHEQAKRDTVKAEAEQKKMLEVNDNGTQLYYINAGGKVVLKTPVQISLIYMNKRDQLLGMMARYMTLALVASDNVLVELLKTYHSDLVALGKTITDTTNIDLLVYPTLPDMSSLDSSFGEDLLA